MEEPVQGAHGTHNHPMPMPPQAPPGTILITPQEKDSLSRVNIC
jgi:hypothetical protein